MECEHRLEKNKMANKVCCKSCYDKQHYKDNVEHKKQYRKDNAECIKQWCKDNAEHINQRSRQWNKDNAEYYKQYKKQYQKERRKSDPLYRMITNMRSRLYQYSHLKGNNKTKDLIGCSPQYLRDWLERQFKEGMNWNNHGEWHIDHILPLCAASNEYDFKILAHYTNLQPVWAKDNLSKGGR